ncbi:MAG: hypothetical protein H7Z72_06835 [Bacteroidetes bacterium]|nr:hypothetical protein [Fibrella sp.]
MRNYALLVAVSPLAATHLLAQAGSPTGTIWRPNPRHYAVKQALEVESIVPMD